MNRFQQFERHFMHLDTILKGMTAKGVLTDPKARLKFRKQLELSIGEKDEKLQQMVPKGLVNSKDRLYALPPIQFRCLGCAGKGYTVKVRSKNKVKFRQIEGCEVCGEAGYSKARLRDRRLVVDSGATYQQSAIYINGEDGKVRQRWQLKFGFNCKSTTQVQAYLRSQGYQLPKHRKTGKETTGEKDLEALAHKHNDRVLWAILGIRELRTLKDTFMGSSYDPHSDGRIHSNFGFKPRTGRLNSYGPNIQQVPKRNPHLAKAFRKQFISAGGSLLYERDYSSIEAVITGYLAKDNYFVAATHHSIHAILCSIMHNNPINLDWPTPKIKAAVKVIKRDHPIDYAKAKQIVYLSLYGGKPKMIYYRNPGMFNSVKEATKLQNLFFDTLAKGIRKWQYLSLIEADEANYFETPYGYWHWFWDPMGIKHDKMVVSLRATREKAKQRLLEGDLQYAKAHIKFTSSSDQVLAFRSQSIAASKLKDDLITMHADPEIQPTLRWVIHDAFICEVKKSDLLRYDTKMARIMDRPILGGLVIGSEAQAGLTWGSMEDI